MGCYWLLPGVEPRLNSKFVLFPGGGTASREVQTQPSPSRSFQSSQKNKWQATRNKVQVKVQLYRLYWKLWRTSLVAQWLGICLPMQGTRVRVLVWEDPTCRGATKPVHRNYWACAQQPKSHNYWAQVPQLLKSVHNKRSHRNKPTHRNKE